MMDPIERRRIDDFLTEVRQHTSDIKAATAEMRREREEMAKRHSEKDQEYAEQARDGEFGEDWRTLQQRIDAGMTSLDAVLTGTDNSPLATRIRDGAAERMADLTIEQQRQDQRTDGARFAELNETLRRMYAASAGARPSRSWQHGEQGDDSAW